VNVDGKTIEETVNDILNLLNWVLIAIFVLTLTERGFINLEKKVSHELH
jgi:hypothetical protein